MVQHQDGTGATVSGGGPTAHHTKVREAFATELDVKIGITCSFGFLATCKDMMPPVACHWWRRLGLTICEVGFFCPTQSHPQLLRPI